MKSPHVTARDIDELLSFLVELYSPDFKSIDHWDGGTTDVQGIHTMPWPIYNPTVEAFFASASKECWSDVGYNPESAEQMLQDASAVSNATLAQLKTMLTFCVRGERFSHGHWSWAIEEGYIRRLLDRLQVIRGL